MGSLTIYEKYKQHQTVTVIKRRIQRGSKSFVELDGVLYLLFNGNNSMIAKRIVNIIHSSPKCCKLLKPYHDIKVLMFDLITKRSKTLVVNPTIIHDSLIIFIILFNKGC